ncbi:peptidase inhibitor family I36 protein [Kitasatospora sp. NPDC057692]|uniref:peptidase inhibitor family I36 protein n=1 Tax=Kitasatospora sp. NPDC057692 TaxID=3346215 RepID=UPI003677BD00
MLGKRLFVGAAAGVIFGSVGAPVAAIAAPAGCNGGWVCLYRDDDYKGGGYFQNQQGGSWNLSDQGFNDQTNSWYNNSSVDAKWFYDANLKGTSRCMNNNSSNHSLSIADYDEASSLAIYTYQYAC